MLASISPVGVARLNPYWLAAIGAFAFAFTTNNFTLDEAGHLTKLRAIAYFPLIAAGMILAYRGRYIWGGLIFAAGLGLNIMANHVQMTYYLALTIPVFLTWPAPPSVPSTKIFPGRQLRYSSTSLRMTGMWR